MATGLVLKKGDIIVILITLCAALLGLAVFAWPDHGGTEGLSAEVYLDGELLQTIALADEEQEILLEHAAGYNLLQIGPRGIRMLEADCSNQDCVRAGPQTRPGSVITCLPHRLLVRLSGKEDGGIDAIAY